MGERAVDLQEALLAGLLARRYFDAVSPNVQRQLGGIVRGVFLDRGVRGSVRDAEAGDVLAEAIRRLEARVASWAQARGSFEWLFMLRRVPRHVFEGQLPSTYGYDIILAEALSAASRAARPPAVLPPPAMQLYYEADEKVAAQLARFAHGVKYLSDLHSAYRWVAKGALLTMRRDGLVHTEPSGSLSRSARLYDERVVDAHHRSEDGSLLYGFEGAASSALVLAAQRMRETWLSVDLLSERPELHGRFLPRFVSIDELREFAVDLPAAGWPEEIELLLLAARIAAIYLTRHRAGMASVFQRGYLTATSEFFDAVADEVLGDDEGFLAQFPAAPTLITSGAQLIARLGSLSARTWPVLPGPIIRQAGPQVCFDVAALWERLEVLLRYPPTTGYLANERATHFELKVQERIDLSRWRPTPELAALRGRTLRRGGASITDIDAIGEREGVLLLVSCKSVVHTGEHERGSPRDVRNAASLVRAAVAEWRDKVRALRTGPGDNFDLSAYREVIGVVCTPQVVYVEIGDATAEAAEGLRACSAFAEFVAWVHR